MMEGLLGFPQGRVFPDGALGFPLGLIDKARELKPPVSDYVGWWDAADLDTLTVNLNNILLEWQDKSGNDYHLTSGPSQPTYVLYPSGTAARRIGGIVVPDMSGAEMQSEVLIDAQEWAGFFVSELDGSGTSGCVFGTESGVSNGGRVVDTAGTGGALRHYRPGGAGATSMAHAPANPTQPTAAGLTVDGDLLMWQRDHTYEETAFTDHGYTAGLSLRVGNRGDGQDLDGAVGEILLYDRALDREEFHSVMSYLAMKWGTP